MNTPETLRIDGTDSGQRQPAEPRILRDRLLLLLALDAGACIVVGAASGAFTPGVRDAAVAAAAGLVGVAATRLLRRPAGLPKLPGSSSPSSLGHSKRVLLLVMLVGVIAYVGGNATFALFNAETTNPGSSMASGTLTMGNKVNNGTTCQSYGATTADNNNSACDALLTLTNLAPGVGAGQAKLTIQNTGSIDASKLYLSAPYPRTTLSAQITSGATVTSLTVAALTNAVSSGNVLQVSYGGSSQNFTASAGAAVGATSVAVTSVTATATLPINSRVLNTSGNASAATTECADAKTTSSPVAGATYGTQLNFNAITNNPLCQAMLFYVQEQSATGKNYCWYGRGSSASPSPDSNGQCRTPTTATLSSTLGTGSPITSLPVAALTGNVKSGDSIVLTEGSNTQTFVASAAAYINDTSIPVSALTPNYAYTSAATVKDTTAFSALDGDATDTISSFDTGHPQTGRIQLYPVTANNTTNNAATVELNRNNDAGYSRIFYVGVYMPASSANQLQGLVSTFGLNWHIDQ